VGLQIEHPERRSDYCMLCQTFTAQAITTPHGTGEQGCYDNKNDLNVIHPLPSALPAASKIRTAILSNVVWSLQVT
jgi:hypothetical protein